MLEKMMGLFAGGGGDEEKKTNEAREDFFRLLIVWQTHSSPGLSPLGPRVWIHCVDPHLPTPIILLVVGFQTKFEMWFLFRCAVIGHYCVTTIQNRTCGG